MTIRDGYYERLTAAAVRLNGLLEQESHDIVVVLGSGLGSFPETLEGATSTTYDRVPGFPLPSAIGHKPMAYSARMGNNRVLFYSGRIHAYEGHSMDDVTFHVRTAILAGCKKVLLTNACGGLDPAISPGEFVALTDHINFAGLSPIAGEHDERFGPYFPDMTDVYTPALRAKAHEVADEVGVPLKDGVYLWWRGPMFETPAEIQMAKRLGASVIGMSTVPEATAARQMGAQILGISLCSNLAAGISPNPITSEEVMEAAEDARGKFTLLLNTLLPQL